MPITTVYVLFAAITSHIVAYGIGCLTRRALVKYYKRRANEAVTAINALGKACRDVLSPAWIKKVERRATKIIEEMEAKRNG